MSRSPSRAATLAARDSLEATEPLPKHYTPGDGTWGRDPDIDYKFIPAPDERNRPHGNTFVVTIQNAPRAEHKTKRECSCVYTTDRKRRAYTKVKVVFKTSLYWLGCGKEKRIIVPGDFEEREMSYEWLQDGSLRLTFAWYAGGWRDEEGAPEDEE